LSTTGDALIIGGSHTEALLENALIIIALDCIKQYYVRCETPLSPLPPPPPPHTHTHTHIQYFTSQSEPPVHHEGWMISGYQGETAY